MSTKRSTHYYPLNTNEKNDLYSPQPSYRKFVLVFHILLLFTFISLMLYVDKLNSTGCNLNDLCNIKEEITLKSTQEKYNIKETITSEFTQEKYITYLPHSGLHNQRVALENAVFMAWALNRTLILPPLILGERFSLSVFDRLEEKLKFLSKIKQKNCKSIEKKSKSFGCEKFRDSFTFYRWDELFDFTFILKNIKVIHREDLIPENLFSKFNISNDKEQVWRMYGGAYNNTIYDNRKFSNISSSNNKISIMELRERNEELFYFNSLFARKLINLKIPENIKFMREIKRTFILSHPTLLDITEKISDKLGGRMKYLSAHARIGDGRFKESSQFNIEKLIKNINRYLNKKNSNLSDNAECKQDDHTKSSKIIYLASDVSSKDDENLKPIFKMFPCTLMLDDFKDLLIPMDKLINERDGLKLTKFLIPILDLMIAANGNHVFTEERHSTFVSYMYRYNDYLQERFNKVK